MPHAPSPASLLDLVELDHTDEGAVARAARDRAALDPSQRALVNGMRRDRALLRSLETPPIPCDFVARLLGEPVACVEPSPSLQAIGAEEELAPVPADDDLPRWTASPPIRLRRGSRVPTLFRFTRGLAAPMRFALAAGVGAAVTAGLYVMSPTAREWTDGLRADRGAADVNASSALGTAVGTGGRSAEVGGDDSIGVFGGSRSIYPRALATTDLSADADLHHGVPRGSAAAPRSVLAGGTRDGQTGPDGGVNAAGPGSPGRPDAGSPERGVAKLSELVLVVVASDRAGAVEVLRRACVEVGAESPAPEAASSGISLVRNVTYEEAMMSLRQALASSASERSELDRLAAQREGARRSARADGRREPRETERALYRELGERLASGVDRSSRPAPRGVEVPLTLGEQLAGDRSAAPAPELQLEMADEGASHALTIDATGIARLLEVIGREVARGEGLITVRFDARRPAAPHQGTPRDATASSSDPWQAWKVASAAARAAGRDSARLIVPIRVEAPSR